MKGLLNTKNKLIQHLKENIKKEEEEERLKLEQEGKIGEVLNEDQEQEEEEKEETEEIQSNLDSHRKLLESEEGLIDTRKSLDTIGADFQENFLNEPPPVKKPLKPKRMSEQGEKLVIPYPRGSHRISQNKIQEIQEVPSGMEIDEEVKNNRKLKK